MLLKKFRKEIDKIDQKLISLLTKRANVAKEVGKFKKENNMNIYQQGREGEIKIKLKKYSEKSGLSYSFLSKLWDEIMSEAIRLQEKVFEEE